MRIGLGIQATEPFHERPKIQPASTVRTDQIEHGGPHPPLMVIHGPSLAPEVSEVLRGARRFGKGPARPGRAGGHKFTVASMASRRAGGVSAELTWSLLGRSAGFRAVAVRADGLRYLRPRPLQGESRVAVWPRPVTPPGRAAAGPGRCAHIPPGAGRGAHPPLHE
jgi:hypothetical protein